MIATEMKVGSPTSVGGVSWAALVSINQTEGTMQNVTLDDSQHDDINIDVEIEQEDRCYSYEMASMRDLNMSWRDFY